MNLPALREWLIQKGITADELDQVVEPPVIKDIGEALMLSLQNDDDIGVMIVSLFMQIEMLEQRVADLEGGAA